jgi:hypothetical protein
MLVDKARRPGESNALTQLTIELPSRIIATAIPGTSPEVDEAAQQGIVNALDGNMAGRAFHFHTSSALYARARAETRPRSLLSPL